MNRTILWHRQIWQQVVYKSQGKDSWTIMIYREGGNFNLYQCTNKTVTLLWSSLYFEILDHVHVLNDKMEIGRRFWHLRVYRRESDSRTHSCRICPRVGESTGRIPVHCIKYGASNPPTNLLVLDRIGLFISEVGFCHPKPSMISLYFLNYTIITGS